MEEETNKDHETTPKSLQSPPILEQQQVNGNLGQENDNRELPTQSHSSKQENQVDHHDEVMLHQEQAEQDAVEVEGENEVFEAEELLLEYKPGAQTPEHQSHSSEAHEENALDAGEHSEKELLNDAQEEISPPEAGATTPMPADPDVHQKDTEEEQYPPSETQQVSGADSGKQSEEEVFPEAREEISPPEPGAITPSEDGSDVHQDYTEEITTEQPSFSKELSVNEEGSSDSAEEETTSLHEEPSTPRELHINEEGARYSNEGETLSLQEKPFTSEERLLNKEKSRNTEDPYSIQEKTRQLAFELDGYEENKNVPSPDPQTTLQVDEEKREEQNKEDLPSVHDETQAPPIEVGQDVYDKEEESKTPEQSPLPEARQENEDETGDQNNEELPFPFLGIRLNKTHHRSDKKRVVLRLKSPSSGPLPVKDERHIHRRATNTYQPPVNRAEETDKSNEEETTVVRANAPSKAPKSTYQGERAPETETTGSPPLEVPAKETQPPNKGESPVVQQAASSVTPAPTDRPEYVPKTGTRALSPPKIHVGKAEHPKENPPVIKKKAPAGISQAIPQLHVEEADRPKEVNCPVVRKDTPARSSQASRLSSSGNRSTPMPNPSVEAMATHPKGIGGEEQRRREERSDIAGETRPKHHQPYSSSSSSSFSSSFYSSLPSQDREQRENFPQESVANLKMIFLWKDTSAEYIAKGEFDAAYGIMDGRNRLEPALKNAVFLLNYCVTLFATNRMREYATEREKIMRLIVQKCRPTNKEMLSLAGKLAKDKQYFASLIMFEITLDMFFDAASPYTSIAFTERCMQGMKNAVSNAVEDEELLKYYVTRTFLPKMHSMKEAVERLVGVNPRFKCIKLGWITHCIEVCDSNDRSRIALLRRATDTMRDTLRDAAVNKYQIYGTLLNNLGTLYMQNGARDQAIDCYFRASQCFNQAEDFETDEKRERYIRDVGRAVRAALGELTEEDLRDASKVAV